MLTDAQLLPAFCVAVPILFCAAYALGDIAGRVVGGLDTPADPVDTLSAMGRAASAMTTTVCAAVVVLAASVVAWVCRPEARS